MTTDSEKAATITTSITTPSTLIEELIERSRLSWVQITVAVGLVLILFLAGAMYLDGLLTWPLDIPVWRTFMLYPAIIVYLVSIQAVLRRSRDSAIKAFRPLVPKSDDSYRQLVAEAPLFNRRREWLALGISAVAALVLNRSWSNPFPFWLRLYWLLTGALGLGLTGWFIFVAVSGTRLFTKLQRCRLDIDIFNLKPLEAIGRWSLTIAVALIAGITLSVVVAPPYTITVETIIIYIPLILAPVLVFFLNMTDTHSVMAEAKERQLRVVLDSLRASSAALEERVASGEIEDVAALLDSFSAWVAVENRVNEAPEWPYTRSIIRGLAVSTLLPVFVFILEGVLLQLLMRSMSLGE